MEDSYITVYSKSGNKEFFNIVLYNNLSSNIVNRINLNQNVEYCVDDGQWETFYSYYNNYSNRKVIYGYSVKIKNYSYSADLSNYGYNIIPVNNYFTIKADIDYILDGDLYLDGFVNTQELDDMTANELLSYIYDLRNKVSYLNEKIDEYSSYNIINLYPTYSYVDEYYVSKTYLSENGGDITYISDKLDKYIEGPYAYLTNTYITYESYYIEDISQLFQTNDLYKYTFKSPYLMTTYNTAIWSSSPYPSYNNGAVTFKENIDIVDFEYKINVSSTNYDEDIYLTQKAAERIYFLQGESITLDTYTQKNLSLSTYLLTNISSYSVDVDWINLPNLNSALIYSNTTSTDSRTGVISIIDSNNYTYTLTIIQSGNPNYDPNSGNTPAEETEVEYEIDFSGYSNQEVVSYIEQNGITITLDKANGGTSPTYYTADGMRLYAKNTMTISHANTITKIEFTAVSNKSGYISTDIPTLGELTSGVQTWEGDYNEILFTVSDSGQYRISAIKVTVKE